MDICGQLETGKLGSLDCCQESEGEAGRASDAEASKADRKLRSLTVMLMLYLAHYVSRDTTDGLILLPHVLKQDPQVP